MLPEGHRPKERKPFVRYPCTLFFCRSLPGMSKPLLVSWYVPLEYHALRFGSYICLLVPLLYCRFHCNRSQLSTLRRPVSRAVAAAVPTSLHLCLRRCGDTSACCCETGNSGRLVYSRTRALADAMRSWREGSSRPEKRPDSPQDRKSLSRAVIHTCVVQVVAMPVMITPREILGGSVFRHSGWAVTLGGFSRPRVLIGPLGKTSFFFVFAEVLTPLSRLYGRQR